MPSTDTLPTIPDTMRAFRGEVRGIRDDKADVHTGSNYDIWGGTAAILLTREAKRERDIFRANYFDHSQGKDLDEIVEQRFHDLRIQDTTGDGEAILTRTSTSAGAGTIWRGTRIETYLPKGTVRTDLVSADTPVGAADTFVRVPIDSVLTGSDAFLDTDASGASSRLGDPLWDNSWTVVAARCSAGTSAETPEQLRSRLRQNRVDTRRGYPAAIVQACKDAGASNVVLFGSDYTDTPPGQSPVIGSLSSGYGDCGINRIFVGDTAYSASHALLVACRKAMSSAAVFGTGVGIWGMTPTDFAPSLSVQLWDDPGVFDQDSVKSEVRNAVVDYFNNRGNAFYFRYVSLQGAIMRQVRDVQTVTFSGGPAEPTLTTFLSTIPLPRYRVNAGALSITLSGP